MSDIGTKQMSYPRLFQQLFERSGKSAEEFERFSADVLNSGIGIRLLRGGVEKYVGYEKFFKPRGPDGTDASDGKTLAPRSEDAGVAVEDKDQAKRSGS